MKISSDLPLFVRANAMLDRIDADLSQAKNARSALRDADRETIKHALGDSIGRSLHNIYCGMEAILEDIADTIDGGKPAGGSYHRKLLDQMAAKTTIRPPVVDLTPDLRDLMRFRHVFRKVYGEPLRLDEILEKLDTVEKTTLPSFLQGLERLRAFLEVEVEDPLDPARQSPSDAKPSDGEEPDEL